MAPTDPGPYTRSRTNLFLSYRDSAVRSSSTSFFSSSTRNGILYDADRDDADESKGLIAGDADLEAGRGGRGLGNGGRVLPPKWVDIADRVDEIVDKVKPKMAHLDKLHAKHVLPGFKDRSAEEREIENLAAEITRDFRTTQKYIRQIAEMSKLLLTSGGASESKRVDLIMAANVQTALATKVQELSAEFRKKQTAYLRQLKGHDNNGRNGDSSQKDPLASLADDEQYSQSFLQPNSLSQSQLHVSPVSIDIQRRDQEISNIAQSITDLADMFKDLSSLVIDQGTLLDRVDWNVEQMGVEVKGAVEELKVAATYQRRSGKCQLIFLLLLLIFGCFIVIIYRPSRSSSLPPMYPPKSPTDDGVVGVSGGLDQFIETVEGGARIRKRARDANRFTAGRGVAILGDDGRRKRGEGTGSWPEPFREGRKGRAIRSWGKWD